MYEKVDQFAVLNEEEVKKSPSGVDEDYNAMFWAFLSNRTIPDQRLDSLD